MSHPTTNRDRPAARILTSALRCSFVLLLSVLTVGCGTSYRDIYPKAPPAHAYEHYIRARIFREQGEFDRALEAIEEALAVDPDAIALRAEHADLIRLDGRPELALEYVDALLDDWPDASHGLLVRARVLRDLGRANLAARELDTLLDREPGHVKAVFLRAELAIDAGQPERARAALEALTDVRPEYRRGWLALGNVAFEMEDHETAIEAYEAFIERDERSELAFLRLAESYREQERPEQREETLAACVEARPTSRSCKVAFIGAVVERPQTDDLSARIDTLVLSVPHDSVEIDDQLLARLAMRVLSSQPLEAASPFIERVLERRPGLVDLAYYLGMARFSEKDYTGALWALREIPADSELYADARFHIGRSQLSLGRVDDAIETGRALIAANPDLVEGYLLLADALAADGQYDDAIELLDDAIATMAANRLALGLQRARILERADRTENAIVAYEALIRVAEEATANDEILAALGSDPPELLEIRLELAALLVDGRRDLERTATLIDAVLASKPHHPDALMLRSRLEAVRGQAERALESARSVESLDAPRVDALLEVADILRDSARHEAARKLLEEALSRAATRSLRQRIERRLETSLGGAGDGLSQAPEAPGT